MLGFWGSLALSGAPAHAAPVTARSFVSDGCTLFKDGPRRQPKLWFHCCYAHDLSIWAGGSHHLRDAADHELRECVAEAGARKTAWLMYWAVRIGMHSPIKLKSKSWGNAWKKAPGYRPLQTTEIDQIALALSRSNVPNAYAQDLLEDLIGDATR